MRVAGIKIRMTTPTWRLTRGIEYRRPSRLLCIVEGLISSRLLSRGGGGSISWRDYL